MKPGKERGKKQQQNKKKWKKHKMGKHLKCLSEPTIVYLMQTWLVIRLNMPYIYSFSHSHFVVKKEKNVSQSIPCLRSKYEMLLSFTYVCPHNLAHPTKRRLKVSQEMREKKKNNKWQKENKKQNETKRVHPNKMVSS